MLRAYERGWSWVIRFLQVGLRLVVEECWFRLIFGWRSCKFHWSSITHRHRTEGIEEKALILVFFIFFIWLETMRLANFICLWWCFPLIVFRFILIWIRSPWEGQQFSSSAQGRFILISWATFGGCSLDLLAFIAVISGYSDGQSHFDIFFTLWWITPWAFKIRLNLPLFADGPI